uniref:Uncharacterized protein n=1 Tax=Paraburkholderia sprentiae WSM5005 TaxID=754502 RepID=A0A1I9YFV6_9BURK
MWQSGGFSAGGAAMSMPAEGSARADAARYVVRYVARKLRVHRVLARRCFAFAVRPNKQSSE